MSFLFVGLADLHSLEDGLDVENVLLDLLAVAFHVDCLEQLLLGKQKVVLLEDAGFEGIAFVTQAFDFFVELCTLEVELVLQIGYFLPQFSVFHHKGAFLTVKIVEEFLSLNGKINVLAFKQLLKLSQPSLIVCIASKSSDST